jgi:diguanylate cyclase (GGDEF)-like protein/PAS domain S-box-containing protein
MKHEQDLLRRFARPVEDAEDDGFHREALDAAGVGTWRLDMVTGLVTWDAVTSRLFSLPPEPREEEALLPVHPDDQEAVAASLERCFAEGAAHDIEFRNLRPDGEIRWIRGIARPRKCDDGERRWLCGIVMDVTDRKRADLALRESRRQLSTLIDHLPGIAYRCPLTAPWRLDYISEGVGEITGYAAPEWTSGRIGWADIVHPEDLRSLEAEVAAGTAERRIFSATYRLVHRDGSTRWVHERGQAVHSETGEALYLEGFIGDVTEHKLLEDSLRRAEAQAQGASEQAHSILDSVPQIVWAADATGAADYLSQQWQEFSGRDRQGDLGWRWTRAVHPKDRRRTRAAWKRSLAAGSQFEAEFRLRSRSGAYRWILAQGVPQRDAKGAITRWYGTCTDVHERVLTQQALNETQGVNRSILDSSPDCIKLLDLNGRILFINPLGPRCLDIEDPAALIGARWTDLLIPESAVEAARVLDRARAGETVHLTMFQPTVKGVPKWWDVIATPIKAAGAVNRLLVIARDVTQRRQSEEQLRWLANHDTLTGLPNRLLFQEHLDALVRKGGAGERFALLLLDVDDFKRINDTLGHDAGDSLLCAFAERLRGATRADDFVARLGGDEFAVILNGVENDAEIAAAVDLILGDLNRPHVHAGRLLDCNASIGASLFPRDGVTRADLLKGADIALYVAKGTWRGNLRIFEPVMRSNMQSRVSMLSLARDALRKNLIVPYYQPKIDLGTGRVEGFEALLRWQHEGQGIQTPDTIAAAFEDLTIASELSDRMIDKVIADIRRWMEAGVEFGHVAINAAAAEFRKGDFADRLLARLCEANIPPHLIQVEITETVFLGRGADYVEQALKTLSAAGVQIALDDFGTGYASLSHLKQFPVDVLKIDRSFVADLSHSPDAAAIIRAVINLGHSLEMKIVAEGIETQAQAQTLTAKGCHYGQGHLYSVAAPAEEVAAILHRLNPAQRAA